MSDIADVFIPSVLSLSTIRVRHRERGESLCRLTRDGLRMTEVKQVWYLRGLSAEGTMARLLFGITLVLSAFLLFLVQPMVARAILPWFGGSSSLWTTCALFFQTALLVGYAYSHALTTRGSVVRQSRVHIALLVASTLFLPPLPGSGWRPADLHDPTAQVAVLLLAVAAIPYVVLSTTAPLAQAWHARLFPGRSPYRLYAWSNASSLVALLGYPVAVEPFLTLRQQGVVWSGFYLAFVALCGFCAHAAAKGPALASSQIEVAAPSPRTPKPAAGRLVFWLWLPFLASTVLLSVTNELCQNISVVPFLWVIPLSLYLATFVLCFERDWLYQRWVFLPLSVLCIWGIGKSSYVGAEPMLWQDILIWCATVFTFCMLCHGELVRCKPAPDHLTLFYVIVALGGMLGGVCVALVAPRIFSSFLELPLALGAIVITVGFVLAAAVPCREASPRVRAFHGGCAALYLLAAGGMATYLHVAEEPGITVLAQRRNFFGVIRVEDEHSANGRAGFRWLYNGKIVHGGQFQRVDLERTPTTYYGQRSGIGLVLHYIPRRFNRHIGIVGLGVGTVAAYAEAGDRLRYYEINPAVVDLTRQYFGFARRCACIIDIVPGDGRVNLEREPPQNFDLLVLDAFSGDAIPTHLLTAEALEVYLRHLRPDGIVAVHISNLYLNLTPVLRGLAETGRLVGLSVQNEEDEPHRVDASDWVLLSRTDRVLGNPVLLAVASEEWERTSPIYWTDDFTSLASVLKLGFE